VYVSLSDLGISIIFLIIVIVGVYIISIMRKILTILDDIKRVLNTNEDSIRETTILLPKLITNVNEIMASIKETAAQASNVLYDVRTEWEALGIYAKAVSQVVKTLFFKK
jgi:uncharacterized protein YoxC